MSCKSVSNLLRAVQTVAQLDGQHVNLTANANAHIAAGGNILDQGRPAR